MKLLDLSLESPEENLALDEALLDRSESSESGYEVLRLWEPKQAFVVLGRSSPKSYEVNLPFCLKNEIPILRRSSGGATVVVGPGCLMYAVVLDLRIRPELAMVDRAHQFVLSTMLMALGKVGIQGQIAGTSDLTVLEKKFSGNSLRIRRNSLIYHGTLLMEMSTRLIEQCLNEPVRQPEYRKRRSHGEFLQGISVSKELLKIAIAQSWQATAIDGEWPVEACKQLAVKKHSDCAWVDKIP